MDTRREHGQYWPGNRTDAGGETPAGTDNGKVDRVDLGTLPADATASEMRTAIRNIQNAMRPLATAIAAALCGFVMAQTAPWDGLRGGVHVVTNEQDAAAMARIVSATNDIAVKMSGLRSDNAAAIAASTNGIPAQIAAATNGLPERMESMIPNLAPYALKSELPDIPDLSPYALKSELPEVPDLSPYATKYEVALATNGVPARIAVATNGLPEKIEAATNALHQSLAQTISAAATALQPAATNGLPEKIAATTNALHQSLAPTITAAATALQPAATNAVAEEMAALSANLSDRIEAISLAFAASNTATRLVTPDGGTYQDATGTVWRLQHLMAPGLFRLDTVQYYTNGVMAAETNELPGVEWTLCEGYDNGVWEILAGESGKEEDVGECYREWRDFTNHVAAADMEDMTKFYYLARLVVAGEEYELQYAGGISESQITFEWPMTEPYKTRVLNFSRTNVTASVWTPIDRVMYASEKEKFISTNDVKAIVTNEVSEGWNEWSFSGLPIGATNFQYSLEGSGWDAAIVVNFVFQDISFSGASLYDYDTSELVEIPCDDEEATASYTITATRQRITQNALGLARLVDLPPLTNGLATAASVAAADTRATDAQTMAAAASNYTARVDAELSAMSNRAPAVVDTGLGVRWVLKATNGVIYAEVEQQ